MVRPRYSIITPTILRPSLLKTCESVNTQTCADWQHIVIIDGDFENTIPLEMHHPQRKFLRCERNHNNWGNTCRFNAWMHATGEYIYYLDDDNYLADDRVLETLKSVTADWAIFPILKTQWGGLHFFCPPLRGCSDGGSFIAKREIGRWPECPIMTNVIDGRVGYDADGQLIEHLRRNYPYQAIMTRPLMVYTSGQPKTD